MPSEFVDAGPSGTNRDEDPVDATMTVDNAMELIYAEIRAAAIESETYDVDKVHTFTETLSLDINQYNNDDDDADKPDSRKSDITYRPELGEEDKPPVSPHVSRAAKARRLRRVHLRARMQSLLVDIIPSFARLSTTSKKTDPRSSSSELGGSTVGDINNEHPLLGASVRAGQSMAASSHSASVFETFHAGSTREALLDVNPPSSPQADSIATGAGNDRDVDSPNVMTDKFLNGGIGTYSAVGLRGGYSKIRARAALTLAVRSYFENDAELHSHQLRYAEFAKQYGWMALCVCAHTETFNNLAESDEISWKAICEKIGENVTSIELYAAYVQLDWCWPANHKVYPELLGKRHYLTLTTRHAISLTNEVNIPRYNGKKQIDIEESFYENTFGFRGPQTDRIASKDGKCAMCGSPDLCNCVAPNDRRALVEIGEYPERGIGVRSLRSIKAGEIFGVYLGEMKRPPLRDTTYVIEQGAPGEGDPSKVCLLDASERGTWTRYINHSCRPAAEFVAAAIGKKRWVAVQAVRNIRMFEEVTVDYGDQYWRGRECLCGEEECRFGGEKEEKGKGKERERK